MSKKKLYVSSTCGYCENAEEKLKKEITKGEIEIVNVDKDPKAREFVIQHFEGVPTLLTEDNGDGNICEIDIESGKKVKCVPKGSD